MAKDFCVASVVGFFLGLILLAGIAIGVGWFVSMLWNNCLVDTIDGLHTINLWQGIGIAVLINFTLRPPYISKK